MTDPEVRCGTCLWWGGTQTADLSGHGKCHAPMPFWALERLQRYDVARPHTSESAGSGCAMYPMRADQTPINAVEDAYDGLL